MRWKPASPELSELLDVAMGSFPCQKKKMFGYPAYFLNGNMFTGIHQDSIILRLSERDRSRILENPVDAAPFEPMPGRPMKEYVVLLDSVYDNSEMLDEWLRRSYEYAAYLPPKEAKRKSKPPGKSDK